MVNDLPYRSYTHLVKNKVSLSSRMQGICPFDFERGKTKEIHIQAIEFLFLTRISHGLGNELQKNKEKGFADTFTPLACSPTGEKPFPRKQR
jgi:hypothetical protein